MNLLTTKEAALFLNVKERTLHKWRKDGKGPKFIQTRGPLGVVRYDQIDIDAWVDSMRVDPQNKEE